MRVVSMLIGAALLGFGMLPSLAEEVPVNFRQLAGLVPSESSQREQSPRRTQIALLCLSAGEQVSGLNKICFYNCAGSGAAITVKSYQLCPLSIRQ